MTSRLPTLEMQNTIWVVHNQGRIKVNVNQCQATWNCPSLQKNSETFLAVLMKILNSLTSESISLFTKHQQADQIITS